MGRKIVVRSPAFTELPKQIAYNDQLVNHRRNSKLHIPPVWLLRYVNLTIFQSYRDVEAGDTQYKNKTKEKVQFA